MRKGTISFQARVRGGQARLRVLALRYLNACLLAQRVVRMFIKRSKVKTIGEGFFNYVGGGRKGIGVSNYACVSMMFCFVFTFQISYVVYKTCSGC